MRNSIIITIVLLFIFSCGEEPARNDTQTVTDSLPKQDSEVRAAEKADFDEQEELLTPTFRRPIDDSLGRENTKKYRNSIRKLRSNGVWYTQQDMLKYIDTIFPVIVEAQRQHIIKYLQDHPEVKLELSEYNWQVGMYWMLNKDKHDGQQKVKVDFCVVPTLVKKSDSTVLDFFDTKQNPFYGHNLEIPELKKIGIVAGKGSAYNSGVMWP